MHPGNDSLYKNKITGNDALHPYNRLTELASQNLSFISEPIIPSAALTQTIELYLRTRFSLCQVTYTEVHTVRRLWHHAIPQWLHLHIYMPINCPFPATEQSQKNSYNIWEGITTSTSQ